MRHRKAIPEEDGITKSCGNIFEDLGLPNPLEHKIKSDLSIALGRIIKRKRYSPQQAADRVGLTPTQLSSLLRGHFKGITITRLKDCLTALGQQVDIEVHVRPAKSTSRRPVRSIATAV